ncbi:hypothetical protein [Corynebacterium sp.]|uniref:hypothetical protein n=1 Tax=Corynebacterium sp. TaxID=1720 RepID=UPI0025C01E21|nr:hypothetical protein [Corynebacterium sp.]
MNGTDFVLIALICGYFTSIIRQSWLSTRIDDLKHDNDRLRWDVERDVETLETQIAREAGNRRSTCTQWHREVNTRLWTLENQHDTPTDAHEDLDVPDTDAQPIPDKETTPCPTTSATPSPASETPSGAQPETSSDAPGAPGVPVSRATSTGTGE